MIRRTRTNQDTTLPRWKKIGGGSFRVNGMIIKPNEIFHMAEKDIPTAFRDLVVPLDEKPVQVEQKKKPLKKEVAVTVEKAAKKEEAETKQTHVDEAVFRLDERRVGWFDIVDEEGKRINEKALRKEKAEELLAQLLA